ncbi:hypothetical protein VTH06DRAFT_8713 [Thermothelomyces fergusii]
MYIQTIQRTYLLSHRITHNGFSRVGQATPALSQGRCLRPRRTATSGHIGKAQIPINQTVAHSKQDRDRRLLCCRYPLQGDDRPTITIPIFGKGPDRFFLLSVDEPLNPTRSFSTDSIDIDIAGLVGLPFARVAQSDLAL